MSTIHFNFLLSRGGNISRIDCDYLALGVSIFKGLSKALISISFTDVMVTVLIVRNGARVILVLVHISDITSYWGG
jgi:hypothetical protein